MSDDQTPSTKRGRPRKTSLQDRLELAANVITGALGQIVEVFEDKDAGKVKDVERMATFSYLRQILDKTATRSANLHENARLTSGTFSLNDAAANYRESPVAKSAAAFDTPQPQLPGSYEPSLYSPPAGVPEGFIPVHLRKPHLVYDEATGRAIGRAARSVGAPVAPAAPRARHDLVPDPDAGFIEAGPGDTPFIGD